MRHAGVLVLIFMFITISLSVGILAAEGEKPYAAPDVKFKVGEDEKAISDYKDNVLLVHFGRIGTKKTNDALSKIQEICKSRSDELLKAIQVNVAQKKGKTKKEVEKLGISFPVINDYKCEIIDKFKPDTLPCLYIIDKFGSVRYIGSAESDKVSKLIDGLMAEKEQGSTFFKAKAPEFKAGEAFAPITVSTLGKKSFNIYRVFNRTQYTFIFVTFKG